VEPRKPMRDQIKIFADHIEVPYLLHFTRAENLPSIMRHGLLPVASARHRGIAPIINDTLRLDGHLNATSVSIGHPNYKMFWKYRIANETVDWAVIGIKEDILWQKSCGFCKHNAADSRISLQVIENLQNKKAFEGMFNEIDGVKTREEQKLKRYDPTDVQAEVLVFENIEESSFLGVAFNKESAKKKYESVIRNKQIIFGSNNSYFSSREYVRKSC
jgi:hypothetical protein